MVKWALLTHYLQTYKEEVFLSPEEGAREVQMCSVILVSNPKARFIRTRFEIELDALATLNNKSNRSPLISLSNSKYLSFRKKMSLADFFALPNKVTMRKILI